MWRVPHFLFGAAMGLLMWLALLPVFLFKPELRVHPDGWYYTERMCRKTAIGGFGWSEECVDVKRRPR